MNRLFALLSILVLVGAGCFSNTPTNSVGDWYVTFDYGSGWNARTNYLGGASFNVPVEKSVRLGKNRVWIQNTDKPVVIDEQFRTAGVDYDQSRDWILVDISAYPGVADAPSDALPITYGDKEFHYAERGPNILYYWHSGHQLYEMYVYTAKGDEAAAEIAPDVLSTIREIDYEGKDE